MKIPIDYPDYGQFYRDAKKQGVKVTSRFIGVHIYDHHGQVEFRAVYGVGKSRKYFGAFPFTKLGEEAAARAYERHILSIGKKPRYAKTKEHFKL